MKIIDFARKGNVVRFFLGADDLTEWYGDDWNDCPYEHNAGPVYDEFVSGHRDILFPYDVAVLEPCDGVFNTDYCKDDMRARQVPCIIAMPQVVADSVGWDQSFSRLVGVDGIQKFYFGDHMEPEVVYAGD